jgi:U4/U6 small nuclear ribonucleoprotein PRP3
MPEKRPYSGPQGDPNGAKRPRPSDAIAAAKAAAEAKAAEIRARLAANNKQSNGASPAPPATSTTATLAPGGAASSMDRLAALKARMAAAAPSAQAAQTNGARPSIPDVRRPEPPKPDAVSRKPGPKPEDERPNPYYDPTNYSTKVSRAPRNLLFNEPGKFLEQGSKVRAQKRLEDIKKMLAKQARRAGLDENSERGFAVQAPPDIEWWDEGLLEDKTYDCQDDPKKVHIETEDSLITIYIQHPPFVKAPQDQRLIETKPMYLTQKEQAKLRRMRRAEELKEHQAKIRLGLEPPPPPKVKRGNMMRVMGEQAIADPTAVEMLVEKQIAERQDAHEQANAERKLTKEERLEKLEKNQVKDAQKALYMCVFKIDSLAYGKHRFQIDQNSKQLALTGITLFNPNMNMVIVEGGIHSINKFKKLMLHRIKWEENARPTDIQAEKQETEPQWLRSLDAQGNVKDLSANKCVLVFEGEVKQRAFRKWGSKMCETDGEAKQLLSRSKLDSVWALAKSTT